MSQTTVSSQLVAAMLADGRSLRTLAKDTGIDIGVLSRFVRGERGISDETFSSLCLNLGLELRPVKTKERKHRKG